MAKFIYIQDFHVKGRNSQNRLGNYFQDCLLKLDEIISLAKKHKCDAIIDGGDLLETECPTYAVLDEIADRIEKGKVPLHSLLGNHAMYAGHKENSKAVGLAHLQKRSELFHDLEDLDKNLKDSKENFDIIGIDYDFGIEEKLKKDGIYFKDKNRFNIGIIHAMVTPKPFFKEVSHLLPKDIKTNASLVLLAHYHHPFEQTIDNTTFLNIGCCARDNINEANIEPSVLFIDTDKREWEIIKLKSAKKGEEVFDLKNYTEYKQEQKSIKEFLESLKDINFESMDLGQQLVKIGKEKNVEQEVIDYSLEKIKECKNA